jgi:hypothetical protein
MKRMKREPAGMAAAPLSANSLPGEQGVFIGVLCPVRQIDDPSQFGLAPTQRALAACGKWLRDGRKQRLHNRLPQRMGFELRQFSLSSSCLVLRPSFIIRTTSQNPNLRHRENGTRNEAQRQMATTP